MSKKSMSQANDSGPSGPSRIFIVRHGDRVDHEAPVWRRTSTRPHDSPLSQRGHVSAHLLGRYLATVRGVKIDEKTKPGDIVFLSSPLQRTVETAHGIIRGIAAACNATHVFGSSDSGDASSTVFKSYDDASSAADAIYADLAALGLSPFGKETSTGSGSLGEAPMTPILHDGPNAGLELNEIVNRAASAPASSSSPPASHAAASAGGLPLVPIYLEPAVMEGEYWLNGDIAHGVQMGNGGIRLVPAGTGTTEGKRREDVTKPSTVDTAEDDGVYRGAAFHRKYVSPLVQQEALACPNRNSGAQSGQLQVEGSVIRGFGDVDFGYDNVANKILEHGLGVKERCRVTINNIASSPALDGKIVIVVGHGETTWEMVKGLLFFEQSVHPYYTSFSEGVRMTAEEITEGAKARSEIEADRAKRGGGRFSGRSLLGKKVSEVPAEWHRWRVPVGLCACDAPHVTAAMQSKLYRRETDE